MLQIETLQAINADLDKETVGDTQTRMTGSESTGQLIDRNFRSTNHQKPIDTDVNFPIIDPEFTEQMRAYKRVLRFYEAFSKFFGTKVSFDWIPERYVLYWFTTFLIICAFSNIFYTIIVYYIRGTYSRIIEPLAVVGITTSGALKWRCHLKYWRKMFSLIFFPRKLCLLNVNGVRANIISKGLRNTAALLKVFFYGVLVLLFFYGSVPLYFFVVERTLMPLVPIEVMFLDQSTMTGFLLAQAFMSFLGVYACLSTIMFGSGFLICVCNYSFQVELIAQDFAELDELWSRTKATSVKYRYAFLCNICMKLQDMKSYLDVVKEIYELKFFLYFLSNYVSQVICLYEITVDDWIAGYTPAIVLFTEMLFYCLVGTRLTTAGDILCDAVYATNWYIYDSKSQALILMILHDSQQLQPIMLGTFGPLDVVTGVTIAKSIYSCYTVMTEVM